MNVNIGSGHKKIEGWINIDQDPDTTPEILMDITEEFTFLENSLNFVYNEHFIEHVSFDEALNLCSKIFVSLKYGGILRIATPDLDFLCKRYLDDWQDQDWIKKCPQIHNNCLMLNSVFYNWGHKFIYNEKQLNVLLKKSGFSDIKRCVWGQSKYKELNDLETRTDSKLILEAKKEYKKCLI